MDDALMIYHGSRQIVRKPEFGTGNPHNDYGLGFYCTESLALAKEWACTEDQSGFANAYRLQTADLRILNLSDPAYHLLNWLAILLQNRIFRISNPLAREGRDYLLSVFLPPYQDYDLIIGYRADDSYFSFANAFLNNTISLAQLEQPMYLGKLGEQVVLKRPQAFQQLTFLDAMPAEREIYYPKRIARDRNARAAFLEEKNGERASTAVYILDILREEWKDDDPRLPRNLSF